MSRSLEACLIVFLCAILLAGCVPSIKKLEPSEFRYAAETSNAKVLNIHIVPHTHDDVGWLKTVDQYYLGLNESIQQASVHEILDSVVASLMENPARTFTYVEQKFFSMWWDQQNDAKRDSVRYLIANKQLNFVNGGWCMHDEATTHYIGMIDQTTLGHTFLKNELGVVPKVGWQLDPFGHSSTQASVFTAKLGFDALYFGRIDYQDLKKRKLDQECEGLWNASSSLNDTTVFWGLTGSYAGQYGPPTGFCFDVGCRDRISLIDLNQTQLMSVIKDFLRQVRVQSDQTKGSHIMLTMGEDFQYRRAQINFASLDVLIESVTNFQLWGKIDVPFMFGPRFDKLNIFYSSPEYYTESKNSEFRASRLIQDASPLKSNAVLSVKADDFYPYSDCEHCFWTGYFASRASLKRLERVASSFLLSTRQLLSMVLPDAGSVKSEDAMYRLEDAVAIIQHHDGVSGTSKQHVAYDYARRVQVGINGVATLTANTLRKLFLGRNASRFLSDLSYCQLLNETTCEVSQQATLHNGTDIYVVVYNGLASHRSSIVRLPVSTNSTYNVTRLDSPHKSVLYTVARSTRNHGESPYILQFDTGPLPPVGAAIVHISRINNQNGNEIAEALIREKSVFVKHRSLKYVGNDTVEVSNEFLTVRFDSSNGTIKQIASQNMTLVVKQEWGYYESFDFELDSGDRKDQNSGAYIFRPSIPEQQLRLLQPVTTEFVRSSMGTEVHTEYEGSWMRTVTRILSGLPYVEVEYSIGPIPITDGRGKEVVTRFNTPLSNDNTFFTDSNGREFMKRRRNHRPTWNLNVHEPVAGNYYPVNTAIYIEGLDSTSALGIITDRTNGGSSLADGSLELMVHRRILADDARGVGEPLNETCQGITPEPPYANSTRLGDGIVVTGVHRVFLGSKSGARLVRPFMDDAFVDPLVFVATAPAGEEVPFQMGSISAIQAALPPNVMLVTLRRLSGQAFVDQNEKGSDPPPLISFLIRLGHQYAIGEDDVLSKPVEVDLSTIFRKDKYKIVSTIEKTLSGNQDYSSWLERRLDWTTSNESANSQQQSSSLKAGTIVTLNPMDILTFEVTVERITTSS